MVENQARRWSAHAWYLPRQGLEIGRHTSQKFQWSEPHLSCITPQSLRNVPCGSLTASNLGNYPHKHEDLSQVPTRLHSCIAWDAHAQTLPQMTKQKQAVPSEEITCLAIKWCSTCYTTPWTSGTTATLQQLHGLRHNWAQSAFGSAVNSLGKVCSECLIPSYWCPGSCLPMCRTATRTSLNHENTTQDCSSGHCRSSKSWQNQRTQELLRHGQNLESARLFNLETNASQRRTTRANWPSDIGPRRVAKGIRGEPSILFTKQHDSKTRKHILTSSYVPFRRAWARPTWREWCGLSTYPNSCAGKTGWNTPSALEMNSKQWVTLRSSSPQGDCTPGLVSHDYTTTCLQGYDVRRKICTRHIVRNARPHVNEVGVVLEMLLPLENLQQ